MKFKSDNKYNSFEAKVKNDYIVVISYAKRQKISEERLLISDYLKNETEYERRQFIFDKNINKVKSEYLTHPIANRHLDLIHSAITHTLKTEGLFKPTFAEIVGNTKNVRL